MLSQFAMLYSVGELLALELVIRVERGGSLAEGAFDNSEVKAENEGCEHPEHDVGQLDLRVNALKSEDRVLGSEVFLVMGEQFLVLKLKNEI